MRRAVVATTAGVSLLALIWCVLRRGHTPVRHPLGAFRCQDCGKAGSDMGELGFPGSAWVSPVRTVHDREHGAITRTEHFDKTSRGTH